MITFMQKTRVVLNHELRDTQSKNRKMANNNYPFNESSDIVNVKNVAVASKLAVAC